MFISSFCSKSLIWVLVSFPSLLVPCIFSLIYFYVAFVSSFILWLSSINSVSILITSVLDSASDRLFISLLLSSFSVVLICFFHLCHICVSVHLLCCKGAEPYVFTRVGQPSLLHCGAVCRGGVREGTTMLPGSALAPLSNKLSCGTGSFSHHGNPYSILQREILSF